MGYRSNCSRVELMEENERVATGSRVCVIRYGGGGGSGVFAFVLMLLQSIMADGIFSCIAVT
jgi:hypothetical protein